MVFWEKTSRFSSQLREHIRKGVMNQIVDSAVTVDKSQSGVFHSDTPSDLSTVPWKTPSGFPTLSTISTTARR
jgi:hypothetical protein